MLRIAAAATAVQGVALAAVAAGIDGGSAVVAVALGTCVVCMVLGGSLSLLGIVSRLAAAMSLLVAVLTYALTVVALGAAYLAIGYGKGAAARLDADWLGVAGISATLTWVLAQVVATVRGRQLVYDAPPAGREASVR